SDEQPLAVELEEAMRDKLKVAQAKTLVDRHLAMRAGERHFTLVQSRLGWRPELRTVYRKARQPGFALPGCQRLARSMDHRTRRIENAKRKLYGIVQGSRIVEPGLDRHLRRLIGLHCRLNLNTF